MGVLEIDSVSLVIFGSSPFGISTMEVILSWLEISDTLRDPPTENTPPIIINEPPIKIPDKFPIRLDNYSKPMKPDTIVSAVRATNNSQQILAWF